MKRKPGRVTVYTEDMIDAVFEYTDLCESINEFPTLAGLSTYLGISRETLNVWRKEPEKQALSDALKDLESKQEHKLVNLGVKKDTYSPFHIFMLKTKYGYVEPKEDQSDLALSDAQSLVRALKNVEIFKDMVSLDKTSEDLR